jgi:hypothetical protein
MRALLAGVFVVTVTPALVGLMGWHYPDRGRPWWAGPLIVVVMFGSMIASLCTLNQRGFP